MADLDETIAKPSNPVEERGHLDEIVRRIDSGVVLRMDEMRRALLSDLEGAIARIVEQKLQLLLPGLVGKIVEHAPGGAARVDEAGTRNVLTFGVEGSHVEVANPFDDPTTFTITLWAKPAEIDRGGSPGLAGRPRGEYQMPGLWLSPVPGDDALHYDSCSTTGERFEGNLEGFWQESTWVHVAWVKHGRTYEFYKNGELVATRPAPKAVFSAGTDYWIGQCDDTWRGQIAEVSIWNVARSHEEIVQSMHSRPAGDEPGLAAHWPLDEGSGATAGDISENGNRGAIVGAVWARSAPWSPG